MSFLSGDVHCAAVGVLKTLSNKKTPAISPADDFRYMINVVTSMCSHFAHFVLALIHLGAIVNTPPPNGVITMVSTLATRNHKTMHYAETDETMVSHILSSAIFSIFSSTHRYLFSPLKQTAQIGSKNLSWAKEIGAVLIGTPLPVIFFSIFAWRKQEALAKLWGKPCSLLLIKFWLTLFDRYAVRTPPPRWTPGV